MKVSIKGMLISAALAGGVFAGATGVASAAPVADLKGTNVVLVHGAFADGSSWSKVIPLLEARGLHVVAVQNPLSSLADDVAATRRVIEQQDGPVVLVGHSWAGVVISQAGNEEKVKSLVYVAAFAPDNGQSIADLTKDAPPPAWVGELRKDSAGFMTLSDKAIHEDFAPDLPRAQQDVVAATQGPWFGGCIEDKVHAGGLARQAVELRGGDPGHDDRSEAAAADGRADRRDDHARGREPCGDAEPAAGGGRCDRGGGRAGARRGGGEVRARARAAVGGVACSWPALAFQFSLL